MCSPIRCSSCGKTSWTGCGNHVDQVFARVPVDQRCTCSARQSSTRPASSIFASRTR